MMMIPCCGVNGLDKSTINHFNNIVWCECKTAFYLVLRFSGAAAIAKMK